MMSDLEVTVQDLMTQQGQLHVTYNIELNNRSFSGAFGAGQTAIVDPKIIEMLDKLRDAIQQHLLENLGLASPQESETLLSEEDEDPL